MAHAATRSHPPKESIKDTLIAILIAFVVAFVFRGFVIEAFIIPTGSMAPTLLGAHMRVTSPQTGATFTVGPWYEDPVTPETRIPRPIQGRTGSEPPVDLTDPVSGEDLRRTDVPLLAGDRILVLKYLYALRDPTRYDVVVFKNPTNPNENYIKRLIGLPGEQLAIVDGDVFTRPLSAVKPDEVNPWMGEGWSIARKPVRAEKAVWQPIFDSAMAPLEGGPGKLVSGFRMPWRGDGPNWSVSDSAAAPTADRPADGQIGVFRYSGTQPTQLYWDSAAPFTREITFGRGVRQATDRSLVDRYAYNQSPPGREFRHYPIADLRVRAAVILPESADPSNYIIRPVITARGHQFAAEISGGHVARLLMRKAPTAPSSADATESSWDELASDLANTQTILTPGKPVAIEFWHVDQSLRLIINGRQVAQANYNWSPAERINFATGRTLNELAELQSGTSGNILADPDLYRKPSVKWDLAGGPVTLTHVAIDRDLHYQPATYNSGPRVGLPANATSPASVVTLRDDQFFVAGDNSPNSVDSRLLGPPAPWVSELMDRRMMNADNRQGIIPRDLLIGKAFFVYFPAGGPVPVLDRAINFPNLMPDFGRMRFIQ